MTEQKPNGKPR